MLLSGKTILILSPQAWGKMFLSKHHYALELARRGNKVYFLNPPDQNSSGLRQRIDIAETKTPGLLLINHKLFFPYWLKFKARPVFHGLMRFHLSGILKRIGEVDIVWSFDLGYLYPLRFFAKKSFKIFHPVDEPLTGEAIDSARGADIIFGVTHEILEKYKSYSVPRHFINHGVSEEFIAGEVKVYQKNNPVRVGLSGNLLRPEIDREILLRIVSENPHCTFEFWGSYAVEHTNIGGAEDPGTIEFINTLKQLKNVILHGAVAPHDLAKSIRTMDAFLICYDVQRDQSRGTNYHKVMEYLGTGRVIVSNNITTYISRPNLVRMVGERDSNKHLPELFRRVYSSLGTCNSKELVDERINFARHNLYSIQLERIEMMTEARI